MQQNPGIAQTAPRDLVYDKSVMTTSDRLTCVPLCRLTRESLRLPRRLVQLSPASVAELFLIRNTSSHYGPRVIPRGILLVIGDVLGPRDRVSIDPAAGIVREPPASRNCSQRTRSTSRQTLCSILTRQVTAYFRSGSPPSLICSRR